MKTTCRFEDCFWTGDTESLFYHCLDKHEHNIVEINDENRFDFTFKDILEETFLLVADGGLYWFLLEQSKLTGSIQRGIYAIGFSALCVYTLKIGRIGDGSVTYIGPCKARSERSDKYDLSWSHHELELLNEEVSSKSVQVFFGPYDDNDVFMDSCEDVTQKVDEFIEDITKDCLIGNVNCFACFDEDQNRKNCMMCSPDIPLDFMNCDDDEETLLRSLTQFSDIAQMQVVV